MRKLVRRLRRLFSPTRRRPDLLGHDEPDAPIELAYGEFSNSLIIGI